MDTFLHLAPLMTTTTTMCQFHCPFHFANALCILTFALFVISTLGSPEATACPSICTCNPVSRHGDRDRGQDRGGRRSSRREVVCSGRGLTGPIDPTTIPKDTVRLDLSNNQITSLRQNAFSGLSSLLQLNLSGNHIKYIEPRAFDGLDQLQNLDLSRNQLGSVNNSMFVGLANLQILSISFNQISTIAPASFDRLPEIASLDFASDFLVCDCQLTWIVKWMKDNKVRIGDATLCAYPQSMRGEKVRKLKKKELHCEWPLELPMFELEPDNSQVVFKGDTIPIECRATYLENANERIIWFKSGHPIETNITAGINITTTILRDQSRIRSTLLLYKIQMDGTSVWDIECRVMTSRGSKRKSVTIIILDNNDTKYCPIEVAQDNKGTFNWPRTISSIRESIVCPHGAGTSHMGSLSTAVATRKCNLSGLWEYQDTSKCEYANELTQRLESASLMGYSNVTTALPIAIEIKSSTLDPVAVTDRMDITFIARTLEKFSGLRSKELGKVMIDVASNLMAVDPEILKASQAYEQSCSLIVQSLEKLAEEVLTDRGQVFNHKSANIAMEVFNFDTDTFSGMACASFALPKSAEPQEGAGLQDFRCFMGNTNATSTRLKQSKVIVEASIQLPGSIVTKVTDDFFKLQFFVYRNGHLFPSITNSSGTAEDRGRRQVTSQVISSKIADFSIHNISSPIILNFRRAPGGHDPIPGYWDFEIFSMGAWRSYGCTIVKQTANTTTAHCNHLTNFALLMDVSPMAVSVSFQSIDLLHPAIYVGSLIFVIFVFLTMVSYICFNSNIRLKRKCRHSLMNMCFGFMNLVMFFAGGINRTDPPILCRIVGIGIHYFSICCLLWIGIGVRNLYKGMTRKERMLPPGEPLPPPRPIIRFYFVGWGIPMIVVGITAAAAANIGNYGGEQICWMDFSISLAACFGVAGFFVLITCIMLIAIMVHLGWKSPEESKGTRPTSTDPDQQINVDSESVVTHRTGLSNVSSILDGEYSYLRQLKASVILLFGFLFTWTLAAMAITQKDFLAVLFSYLYGAAIALLGLFIFMYNCVMRCDVMYNWRRTWGCTKSRNAYAVALSNSQAGSQVIPPGNGHVVQRCQSASSVDSNATNRSANTNQSNHSLKSGSRKTSKCNYVPSHTNTGTDASIDSSTQDTVTRPHMYEKVRGNGYAHRYHHKARNRPKGYKHSRYSQITRDTSDAGATPEASSAAPPAGYADSVSSGSVMARVPPVMVGSVSEREGSFVGLQPQAVSMSSMQSMPAGSLTAQLVRPQWPVASATALHNSHPRSLPIVATHSSNSNGSLSKNPTADTSNNAPHVEPLNCQEGAVLKRRTSREDTRRNSGKNKSSKTNKMLEESSHQREEVPLLEKHSSSEPPTYEEVTQNKPADDHIAAQPLEVNDVSEEPVFDGAAVEMDSLSQAGQSDNGGSDKRETSV